MYQFYNQHFFFCICHNVNHNPRVDVTRKLVFGRLILSHAVS